MYYPNPNHRTHLNILIGTLASFFIFIWGPWHWIIYSNPIWWFDDLGHILYGFFGGLLVLYIKVNYTARGAFLFVGKKSLMFDTAIYVMAGGAFWELSEFIWDLYLQPSYFPYLNTAQYGLVDTMFDLLNTFWSVLFAIISWQIWRKVYSAFWPDEAEEEELQEIAETIQDASKEVFAIRRMHMKTIRNKFRAQFFKKLRQGKTPQA